MTHLREVTFRSVSRLDIVISSASRNLSFVFIKNRLTRVDIRLDALIGLNETDAANSGPCFFVAAESADTNFPELLRNKTRRARSSCARDFSISTPSIPRVFPRPATLESLSLLPVALF